MTKRGDRASLRGLIRCKRLDCPVCGPAVAEREATDMGLAITEHYARGGRVAFVTLTLRHKRAQALKGLLEGLSKAWTTARTSKTPRRLWAAYTDGYIRKLEVTDGENGYHPHLHLLIFLKPDVGEPELAELVDAVYGAWASRLARIKVALVGQDGQAEDLAPNRRRGVDYRLVETVDGAHQELARYAAKDAGRELASAGTKRGRRRTSRSMMDLAAAGAAGDPVAGLRFLEYEDAMKGLARILWSNGLKDSLIDPELQESAQEDDQGRVIAVFTGEGARRLLRNERWQVGPGLKELLDWAEASQDDGACLAVIRHQCRKHGIPPPTGGVGVPIPVKGGITA